MNSAQKQYTNEMRRKFGYYATWNPGLPLKLGDYGLMKNNIFNRISNIEKLNIKFETREDNNNVDLEHNSNGSVALTTKLSGAIPPIGSVLEILDAGIIVEFLKKKSTLFKANKTKTPSIEDVTKLGDEIIKLYKAGKWNNRWVIITELIVAESATILISNTSSGKIELKANAKIDLPNIDIADATFNFSTLFSRGLVTNIIANEGLTPLFKIMGMKTNILNPQNFEPISASDKLDLITPESVGLINKNNIFFGELSNEDLI